MTDPDRHERLALNESRFREINDRLSQELGRLRHQPAHFDFVCECSHLDCREKVRLTAVEYEHLRADPMLFAVADGHDVPDAEDVVARTDRFAMVRKHADVEGIVEATHPRTP